MTQKETYKQMIYWMPTRAERSFFHKEKQKKEGIPQGAKRLLVLGHIPNDPTDLNGRYYDTRENREAQRTAIRAQLEDFYTKNDGKDLHLTLCSGSAGADLETVDWVKDKREEGVKNIYISVELPLSKEGFREYSVTKGSEPAYWEEKYNWMLDKKNRNFIFVHEPKLKWYPHIDRLRKPSKKILDSSLTAKERSIKINGEGNARQYLIDTLEELVAQATVNKDESSPEVLLVNYGGAPKNRGGTEEGLAKLLAAKVSEERIHIVQAGLNVANKDFRLLDDNPEVLSAYAAHTAMSVGLLKGLVASNRTDYFRDIQIKYIQTLSDEYMQGVANRSRLRRL